MPCVHCWALPSHLQTLKTDSTLFHHTSRLAKSGLTCVSAGLLADNNRLGEFTGISDTFDEIMAAERGEVIATITTAHVRVRRLLSIPCRCKYAS